MSDKLHSFKPKLQNTFVDRIAGPHAPKVVNT